MAKDQTLVSYAQNREDLYLYALLGHIKKGFYVDVGANEPVLHSVTRLYYDLGWHGINIEPNVELFDKVRKNRPRDINLNMGASNKRGSLKFRIYPHHNGLSTFATGTMQLHEASQLPHKDVTVQVKTLKEILKAHKVKQIDFMSIDVEGYETEVIEGNDWDTYRPKVLLIEASVAHQWEPLLKSKGFIKEFFDGLNYYYIAKEYRDELTIYNYSDRILKVPITTLREVNLHGEIDALRQRVHELETETLRLRNQLPQMFNSVKRAGKTQLKKVLRPARSKQQPEEAEA